MSNAYNKNVCLFVPNLNTGGAEKNILILANRLYDEFDKVYLATCEEGELDQEIRKEVTTINLGQWYFGKDIRTRYSLLPLVHLIIAENIDVLVSTVLRSNLIASIISNAVPSVKLVVRLANQLKYYKENTFGYPSISLKLVLKSADRIVVLTESIKNEINDRFDIENKTIVINNPVNVDIVEEKSRHNVDHRWINGKHNLLVALGSLSPRKNFGSLIKSVVTLFEEGYNVKLLILGDGRRQQKLQKIINRHNAQRYIQLLGRVENPYKYLVNANLFVMSSKYEGMPNSLLEAIALCRPVVVPDITGISSIVENMENGIVYDGSDLSLTEAISILCDNENLRSKFKKSNRKMRNKYNVDRTVRQYTRLIKKI